MDGGISERRPKAKSKPSYYGRKLSSSSTGRIPVVLVTVGFYLVTNTMNLYTRYAVITSLSSQEIEAPNIVLYWSSPFQVRETD
jgi:hypothetical protein